MSLENLLDVVVTWLTNTGIKVVIALIILAIGWKLIKKLITAFKKFANNKQVDTTLHLFLSAIIEFGLKLILIISLIGYLGFDISSLVAVFATSTLAIGLALQGSLSNLAGSVVILVMRPFKVDDLVEVGTYIGTVKKIDIFYTELITGDNKVVKLPNGSLANSNIINYSSMDKRRVDLILGVGYEADMHKVKNILTSIIESNDKILKDPAPFISIAELADNSVNFTVRVWCNTPDYWDVHFYVLEQAKIKFDEENINIPYPQMDVHLISK